MGYLKLKLKGFTKIKKPELIFKEQGRFLSKSYEVAKTYLELTNAYTRIKATLPIFLLVADMQSDKWWSENLFRLKVEEK